MCRLTLVVYCLDVTCIAAALAGPAHGSDEVYLGLRHVPPSSRLGVDQRREGRPYLLTSHPPYYCSLPDFVVPNPSGLERMESAVCSTPERAAASAPAWLSLGSMPNCPALPAGKLQPGPRPVTPATRFPVTPTPGAAWRKGGGPAPCPPTRQRRPPSRRARHRSTPQQ